MRAIDSSTRRDSGSARPRDWIIRARRSGPFSGSILAAATRQRASHSAALPLRLASSHSSTTSHGSRVFRPSRTRRCSSHKCCSIAARRNSTRQRGQASLAFSCSASRRAVTTGCRPLRFSSVRSVLIAWRGPARRRGRRPAPPPGGRQGRAAARRG